MLVFLALALIIGTAAGESILTFEKQLGGPDVFTSPTYAARLPTGDVLVTSMGDYNRGISGRFQAIATDGITIHELHIDGFLGPYEGKDAHIQYIGLDVGESGKHLFVGTQGGRGLHELSLPELKHQHVTGSTRSGNAIGDNWIDSAIDVTVGGDYVYVSDVSGYKVLAYDAGTLELRFTIDWRAIKPEEQGAGAPCKTPTLGARYKGASCFNPHGPTIATGAPGASSRL